MADVNEKLTESANFVTIKSAVAKQHDDNKFKLTSRAALMQVNIPWLHKSWKLR